MWSSISCADIEDLHERCQAQNYNSSGARPTTYIKKTCIQVLFHSIESLSKRLELTTLKPNKSRVQKDKAPSHTYTTITNIQMTLINHLEHPQTDSVLSCALNQRHQWHQVIAPNAHLGFDASASSPRQTRNATQRWATPTWGATHYRNLLQFYNAHLLKIMKDVVFLQSYAR